MTVYMGKEPKGEMVRRKNEQEYRKYYILMVMEILFIDVQIRNGEKKKVKLAKFYLLLIFCLKIQTSVNIFHFFTNNSVNIFHLNYISLLIIVIKKALKLYLLHIFEFLFNP